MTVMFQPVVDLEAYDALPVRNCRKCRLPYKTASESGHCPTCEPIEAARARLHQTACPGCGCEPEVTTYFVRGNLPVGYRCACGATVHEGVIVMYDAWGHDRLA